MRNTLFFFVTALVALIALLGCSSKQYYEPKIEPIAQRTVKEMPSALTSSYADGALFEDGTLLLKESMLKLPLKQKMRFVNYSYPYAIYSDINGTVSLYNTITHDSKTIALEKTVAAASVNQNTLALVFANNELALYDLQASKIFFKQSATPVTIVDSRLQKPFFLNDLVLFFTLDGKIVIVNLPQKKVLRSIIVSSNDFYNNIIYFGIHENKMVAATHYKLFSITEKEKRASYDIRDALYLPGEVWITTREGEVIALTPELAIKNRIKFPFAHFYAMHVDDKNVYLLESQGFLIVLDKYSFTYDVYEVDVDDAPTFATKDGFYNDDLFIPYAP